VAALRHKNVSSELIISPHKVEVYYLAHRDEFKIEDEIKLRMIVLNNPTDPSAAPARKLAEEILAKLKEGAAFAEMATIYSQGSQHKEGGDWGWWETAKLRKELVEAAAALKAGERSEVIETPDACYIMLVEEKRPTHFKSLGEVRDQIEKSFLLEEQRRLEKQWVERLKKKTFHKYF
jgi:parvulin-like peptidyl-prolyl isomerase